MLENCHPKSPPPTAAGARCGFFLLQGTVAADRCGQRRVFYFILYCLLVRDYRLAELRRPELVVAQYRSHDRTGCTLLHPGRADCQRVLRYRVIQFLLWWHHPTVRRRYKTSPSFSVLFTDKKNDQVLLVLLCLAII